jgi:hypothetical protein
MGNTVKSDELAMFLQTHLEELLNMSDDDILEGKDPKAIKSDGLAMLKAAKAEAGRRRMAAARAGIARNKASPIQKGPQVSVAEARSFLEAAMNDDRYTLAARSLGEMSDEDILRLYHQLYQLKTENETLDSGDR